ncbi:hypothetical protein E1B28_010000 [Marasmius oreades]|uniref:YCII-related domain-containing protein n=1 Tax=Marasmius oreades TaxID=181124 RepID=A0A9P7RWC7_9AGAR|nr:uncharacterized protein E1B28_010000 [Marasmius oreades]KAG7090927.1 hypothetical protein E1B28_010000 [Marasmius oreades]
MVRGPVFGHTHRLVSSHEEFFYLHSSIARSSATFPLFVALLEDVIIIQQVLDQVRQRHLDGIVPTVKSGVMKLGGMMVDPESDVNLPQKKAIGSLVIYEAESVEQVKRMVETDIYYTSGVWDQEKLVICPFFAATPWP